MYNSRHFKESLAKVFTENLMKCRHEEPEKYQEKVFKALMSMGDNCEENLLDIIDGVEE